MSKDTITSCLGQAPCHGIFSFPQSFTATRLMVTFIPATTTNIAKHTSLDVHLGAGPWDRLHTSFVHATSLHCVLLGGSLAVAFRICRGHAMMPCSVGGCWHGNLRFGACFAHASGPGTALSMLRQCCNGKAESPWSLKALLVILLTPCDMTAQTPVCLQAVRMVCLKLGAIQGSMWQL